MRLLQSLTGPSETLEEDPDEYRVECFNPSQVRLKRLRSIREGVLVRGLQSLTGPSETVLVVS